MGQGMQRTLIILKPDALQRGLVGSIIQRFEQKGLKLVAIRMRKLDTEILDRHYEHHKGKPFLEGLKSYMGSAPCLIMIWQGLDAVETVRKLCGITKAREAEAGSIRGDFAMSQQQNLVHASDSPETALKEMDIFFPKEEGVHDWKRHMSELIYSEEEMGNKE